MEHNKNDLLKQIEFKKLQRDLEKEEEGKKHSTNFGPEESIEIHTALVGLDKQKKEQTRLELQQSMRAKKMA